MGHINAQHKPLCHILKKSLFRKVKSFIDTVQGIMKDKGIGPLLSRAPYLFVVKKTDEGDTFFCFAIYNAFEACLAACEVIQTRR